MDVRKDVLTDVLTDVLMDVRTSVRPARGPRVEVLDGMQLDESTQLKKKIYSKDLSRHPTPDVSWDAHVHGHLQERLGSGVLRTE